LPIWFHPDLEAVGRQVGGDHVVGEAQRQAQEVEDAEVEVQAGLVQETCAGVSPRVATTFRG
jgi:hypothetical protein